MRFCACSATANNSVQAASKVLFISLIFSFYDAKIGIKSYTTK